jgi:uncharacterized membrane protein
MSSEGAFSTRRLVITAVLIAITIVLSIPLNLGPLRALGFISFGAISFTILVVPTIIGAILEGWVVGLIVGAAFGLFSMFLATQQPAGSPDALFADPFISVLPRLFIGPVAWLVYRGMQRAQENARLVSASVAGTLTNTILVIGAISIRLSVPFFTVLASVGINIVIELVVCAVIVVAVVNAVRGTAGGRGKSSV